MAADIAEVTLSVLITSYQLVINRLSCGWTINNLFERVQHFRDVLYLTWVQ
jgi:hypothetical protein